MQMRRERTLTNHNSSATSQIASSIVSVSFNKVEARLSMHIPRKRLIDSTNTLVWFLPSLSLGCLHVFLITDCTITRMYIDNICTTLVHLCATPIASRYVFMVPSTPRQPDSRLLDTLFLV